MQSGNGRKIGQGGILRQYKMKKKKRNKEGTLYKSVCNGKEKTKEQSDLLLGNFKKMIGKSKKEKVSLRNQFYARMTPNNQRGSSGNIKSSIYQSNRSPRFNNLYLSKNSLFDLEKKYQKSLRKIISRLQSSKIQSLNLAYKGINDEKLKVICFYLRDQFRLRSLNLMDNKISDKGLHLLCHTLQGLRV